MSKLTDRVSFLKGLAEGMKLDLNKDENKLMTQILDLLSDMAQEIDDLQSVQDELNEYMESIDDDLSEMEEILYGADEDCDCEDCDDDCVFFGEHHGDGEIIEYACPHCSHELKFNASDVDFDEETLCPACNKPVFPELLPDDTEDDE